MSLLGPTGQPLPQKPVGQVLLEALATNTIFAIQRELQPFLDNKYYSVLGLPMVVGSTVNLGMPSDTSIPVVLAFGINVRVPITEPDLVLQTPDARTAIADNVAAAFLKVLTESPAAEHDVIVMRPIPTTYAGPLMCQGATDKVSATFSLGVDTDSMTQWFRVDVNVGFAARAALMKQ
jgi:hypothetical protein